MNNKNNYFEDVKTPSWDKFKKALELHIEYLQEMEKKDPKFNCDCSVCRCGALNIEETQ